MTAVTFPTERSVGRCLPLWAISAVVLIAASFLIRLPSFGNPSIDIDEQFYLLVGDRMLHGDLPYVSIWDRKPIGLFLVYAAIRLLGGNGVLQYQLVAAVCAGTTAWIISRLARAATGELAGGFAGLAYLVWIETVGGGGGQSPIFYNMLVAAGAWLSIRTLSENSAQLVFRSGVIAMALLGLAIQIKYTVLFEGCFFGIVTAVRLLRTGSTYYALTRCVLLIVVALAPTGAAVLCYAVLGHKNTFLFANFTSIGLRAPAERAELLLRLLAEVGHLIPLGLCAAAATWLLLRNRESGQRHWLLFVGTWLSVSLLGFASVGAFYYHYLLPVFVPLAVLAAPIFGIMPLGPVIGIAVFWVAFGNLRYPDFGESAKNKTAINRLLVELPPDVRNHCLFMYDGPPVLFLLGHACSYSRYVFPDHLASIVEAPAVGVDPVVETKRILAMKPAAITISLTMLPLHNRATYQLVVQAIRRDYRMAVRVWNDGKIIGLYVRRQCKTACLANREALPSEPSAQRSINRFVHLIDIETHDHDPV